MSLVCYSADQIDYIWPQVEGLIQKALDFGSEQTTEEIRADLKTSKLQLWVWANDKIETALITAIQERSGIKFCLYLALGGSNISAWVGCMPIVEKWAKEHGCTEMRIYGRIGWAKALGFNVEYTKMSKQI